MAWPPPVFPTNRTNATPQQDTHPADHNAIALAINDTVTHFAQHEADNANGFNGVNSAFKAQVAGIWQFGSFRMYTASISATTDGAGAVTVPIPGGTFVQPPMWVQADDFYVGQSPGTPTQWAFYKIDQTVLTATSVRVVMAGWDGAARPNNPVGFRFVAFGVWTFT